MTAHELLDDLGRRGARLEIRGDKIHVDAPKGALSDAIKAELAAQKVEILRLLGSSRDIYGVEEARQWIEERSSILEFDGGLSREAADTRAFEAWFRIFVSREL